jgi:hypothetical protein
MSFIRLILEYADVIWDSQNQSLINKLENVRWFGLLFFLDKIIVSVFCGLNFTSHFSDQI